jgi:hypothetical protein
VFQAGRQLLYAAANSEDAIHNGKLRFSLVTPEATAMVLSAWIIRNGEDFPRLITCFIL